MTKQTVSLEVLVIDPSIIGQNMNLSVIIEAGNEIIEEVRVQKNNGSWSYTSIQLAGGDYSLQLRASDPYWSLDEFGGGQFKLSIEGKIATPISDVAQDQDDDRSNVEESVFQKQMVFTVTMANKRPDCHFIGYLSSLFYSL